MSAGDAYDKAEDYFKEDNFAAAAEWYDKACELAPNNARYLSNRAANSLKLKKYAAALADTQASLAVEANNGRTLLRQGQALFYLDRYEEALAAFEAAAKTGQDKTDIWVRKCNAEIERAKAGPTVPVTAQPAATPVVHKITALPPPEPEKKKEKAPVEPPKLPNNLAERTRDQWFQSSNEVTLTLLAKNLKQDNVKVNFDESKNELSVELEFPTDSSKYTRTWKLWGQVTAPVMTLTAYKIELVMAKKDSQTWDAWERKEGEEVAPIVKRENTYKENVNYTAYPTSAKVMKNWEEVEAEAKKAEAEEKPDGEAALQKLFQSIYSGADEDTRRAMVKSFQTSGGTVLSTNWKEVKDKNYEEERQAPAGQEMVDWNSKTRGAVPTEK